MDEIKMTKRIGVNPVDRERIEGYNDIGRAQGLETPELIVDETVPVGQILLIPDPEPFPAPTIHEVIGSVFWNPRGAIYPER